MHKIKILHETFANLPLLSSMKVAATREAYIINDLHLTAHRQNAITNVMMRSCVGIPDVLEHNHVRHFQGVIIPNHFDDRVWFTYFRMTKTTFEMVCDENSVLVSSVMKSHALLRQSHVSFLKCTAEFIR